MNDRIKKIYEACLRKPVQAREAYLDRVCGPNGAVRTRVERLLAARDELGDFLAEPTRRELPDGVEEVREERGEAPGTVIGRYKLLQKIGEGGFGAVYMAAQAKPVKRKVALKIIKLGMDTEQVVARFEAERQALALMDHPNIAKVLDGGATENGRPYFVMELVRGVPITEYCETARVKTRERLELFKQVCHAVQHAHQKGIIHRDIKPSNVLVTLHDGVPVPKVIDFGIAKAMDRTLTEKTLFTQFHQMIGTPEYMAPEQAEMSGLDIDTRADIYSLGVLLYELLTGTKPFDLQHMLKRGYEEILRTIREEDPPKPSTRVSTLRKRQISIRGTTQKQLTSQLRGDLDWIVMKALDKNRQRRYETANAFAADIQRHIEDQPVVAGPPTPVYRLKKYVRRHRAGVAAATLVAAALVVGLTAATLGWLEASSQTGIAERALKGKQEALALETKQRERAQTGERKAKEAQLQLEKALRKSEGTRLSALSQAVLPRDPGLALLLAIEGARRELSAFANKALLEAVEQSPRREILLAPPEGRVLSVAWSRDESRVATGTTAGDAHVWDARSGKLLHSLETDHGFANAIHWLDEELLVHYLSRDPDHPGSILVRWNPATAERRYLRRREQGCVVPWQAKLGRAIPAFELESKTILLLSRETGEVVRRIGGFDELNYSAWPLFSPDLSRFLGRAMQGGACSLRDGVTGAILAHWQSRGNQHARFSIDSKLVVTREPAGIRVRDAKDGRALATMADSDWSWGPVFRNAGRHVVATQGQIKVWDTKSGAVVRDLDYNGSFNGRIAPDGSAYIGSKHLGGLEILSLVTGEPMLAPRRKAINTFVASDLRFVAWDEKTWLVDPEPAADLQMKGFLKPAAFIVHPDGRTVIDVTGTTSIEPRIWDLSKRRARSFLAAHQIYVNGRRFSAIYDGALSPGGTMLATAGHFGWIYLWDPATGRRLRVIQVSPDRVEAVTSVEFSPDGRHIVAAGTMPQALVFDVQTGKQLYGVGDGRERTDDEILRVRLGSDRGAHFSPDGKRILFRYRDRAPSVWDVATRKKLFDIEVDPGLWANGMGYSPCGRWILVSATVAGTLATGTTYIVHAVSNELVCKLPGANVRGPLFPLGFDAKGNHVLVCTEGEGVGVYEVPSGKRIRLMRAPGEQPNRACFSPDGRWILGVSYRKLHVYVWDARTGRLLHHLTDTAENSFFHNAAFTADSKSVLVTTSKGLRVLPIDLLSFAIQRRPRDLLPSERKAYGIPETGPDPPVRAWRTRNDLRRRIARQRRIDSALEKLTAMLGDIGYHEDTLLFRQDASRLGSSHDIAWAYARVAGRLLDYGYFDQAVKAYELAIEEGAARHDPTHLGIVKMRMALTRILAMLGRGREIGPHLEFMEKAKLYRPSIALSRGHYLLATGKPKEAIAQFEKAEQHYGRIARQARGEALTDLGEYGEAEVTLKGTYTPSTARTPGLVYLDLRDGVRRFTKLYTKWGKPERIAAWKQKAKEIEEFRPIPLKPRKKRN